MRRALVSIGTNSTRYLVVDRGPEDGSVARVAQESRGTRLGVGIRDGGLLDPEARGRTLAAISEYMATIRSLHAVEIAAVATSALRRADDAAAFAAEVSAVVGAPLRIISGEEEARYAFAGAVSSLRGPGTVGVLDVGGGSSEYAAGIPCAPDAPTIVHSVEIGAVRLAEAVPALLGDRALGPEERGAVLGEARALARAAFAPLREFPAPEKLVVVGGTMMTVAVMLAGDPEHAVIDAGMRACLIDDLLARDREGRKAIPRMRHQRADILPAGVIVVDEAVRALRGDAVTTTIDDVLLGVCIDPRADFVRL